MTSPNKSLELLLVNMKCCHEPSTCCSLWRATDFPPPAKQREACKGPPEAVGSLPSSAREMSLGLSSPISVYSESLMKEALKNFLSYLGPWLDLCQLPVALPCGGDLVLQQRAQPEDCSLPWQSFYICLRDCWAVPCWRKVTQAVKDHRWTFLGRSHSPTSARGSVGTGDEAVLYGFCTVMYNGFCPLACSNGAGLGSRAAVTWPAAWFSCPTRAIPPVLSLGGLWEEGNVSSEAAGGRGVSQQYISYGLVAPDIPGGWGTAYPVLMQGFVIVSGPCR